MMMMDDIKDGADDGIVGGSGGGVNSVSSAAAAAAAAAGVRSGVGLSGSGSSGLPTGAPGMHYTIPGILHFLQHEWSRFEMERSQWEVEKAELQARIAFLQGERKGQENLKNDLVRRIKMLEYALKQERLKYNKLKYGASAAVSEGGGDGNAAAVATSGSAATAAGDKAEMDEEIADMLPPLDTGTDNYIAVSNFNWKQGRQLLRQYLKEIGYTDTIIDVRSNRVRSLLGLNDQNVSASGVVDTKDDINRSSAAGIIGGLMNGGDASGANVGRRSMGDGGSGGGKRSAPNSSALAEEMMIDTEAAVMANFDFLSSEGEIDDDDDMIADDDGYNPNDVKLKASKLAAAVATEAEAAAADKDAEEVLNEFNFLSNPDGVDGKSQDEGIADFLSRSPNSVSTSSSAAAGCGTGASDGKVTSTSLELGELEQLTITNDNESSYDITAPKETFRKTWSAKYTLRSHFDGVRALGFHPSEPVLITASEDQTLKLWNLQKTIPAKKSASLDVEPVYTFRAHRGAVLSLDVAPAGDYVFSGGQDSTIRVWNMPNPNIDPYDAFDPSVLATTLTGHTDCVWDLSYHGSRGQLLSCGADGTVKLWSPSAHSSPLLKTFTSDASGGRGLVPTSVDWVYDDSTHLVAGYNSGACIIYDIETGKSVIKLDSDETDEMALITKVVSHPTLPLTITAHEDRHIRFFDNNTGKLTHAMVAHLDAVTSLAVDPNGLYLISGSHDCSIRLWNLETKTCVQEITAHRKKFDESIFDVAFHPSKPYIASAGADALAKVFV